MWSQVMCHFVKEYMFLGFCLLTSNESHPISLYKISTDTRFVVSVAILAASVWIFPGRPFHTACRYPKFRYHTLR